jgi:hypothetical protein
LNTAAAAVERERQFSRSLVAFLHQLPVIDVVVQRVPLVDESVSNSSRAGKNLLT